TRGENNRSREGGQSTNNTPRGKSQSRDNTSSDNTRGENNRSREGGQSTNNTPREKSRSRDEGQSTNNTPRGKSQSRDNTSSDNTRGENNRSREGGQSTNNTPRDNTSSRENNSTANSQGIPLASTKQPHDIVSIQEDDGTWTEMTIRGCMRRGTGTLMLLNAPSKNSEYPKARRGFLRASSKYKKKFETFLRHNNPDNPNPEDQMIKYGSIEKLRNANVEDIRISAIYDTDQDPSHTVLIDANGNKKEIFSCFREPWTIVEIGILNEKPELYKRSDILKIIGDNDLDAYRRAVMQPIPVHARPLKEQKRTRNFGLAEQYSKSRQTPQPTTERAGSQGAGSQGAGSQRAGSQRAGSQGAESHGGGSQRAGSHGAESQRAGSHGAQRAGSQGAGSQRAEPKKAGSPRAGSQGRYPDSAYDSPDREYERGSTERKRTEICTICNYERGDYVVTVFPCGHSFDYDCIEPFCKDPYSCHTCREAATLGVFVTRHDTSTFTFPTADSSGSEQ
ncbi:hypothetical protein V500_01582, partial [Pseudogymnoascus sp. VKM F-4518 (FW-2643)]